MIWLTGLSLGLSISAALHLLCLNIDYRILLVDGRCLLTACGLLLTAGALLCGLLTAGAIALLVVVLDQCFLNLSGGGAHMVKLLVVLVGKQKRVGDHRIGENPQQVRLLVDPASGGQILEEETDVGLLCHLRGNAVVGAPLVHQ